MAWASLIISALLVAAVGAPAEHAEPEARYVGPAPLTWSACLAEFDIASAVDELRVTDQFASPRINYAGEPSRQGCAFATIAEDPDAQVWFEELFASAEVPGQLYALTGLWLENRRLFRRYAADLDLASAPPIQQQIGCMGGTASPQELLDALRDGGIPKMFKYFLKERAEARESN